MEKVIKDVLLPFDQSNDDATNSIYTIESTGNAASRSVVVAKRLYRRSVRILCLSFHPPSTIPRLRVHGVPVPPRGARGSGGSSWSALLQLTEELGSSTLRGAMLEVEDYSSQTTVSKVPTHPIHNLPNWTSTGTTAMSQHPHDLVA